MGHPNLVVAVEVRFFGPVVFKKQAGFEFVALFDLRFRDYLSAVWTDCCIPRP